MKFQYVYYFAFPVEYKFMPNRNGNDQDNYYDYHNRFELHIQLK